MKKSLVGIIALFLSTTGCKELNDITKYGKQFYIGWQQGKKDMEQERMKNISPTNQYNAEFHLLPLNSYNNTNSYTTKSDR